VLLRLRLPWSRDQDSVFRLQGKSQIYSYVSGRDSLLECRVSKRGISSPVPSLHTERKMIVYLLVYYVLRSICLISEIAEQISINFKMEPQSSNLSSFSC
jgi:hypothetical protein